MSVVGSSSTQDLLLFALSKKVTLPLLAFFTYKSIFSSPPTKSKEQDSLSDTEATDKGTDGQLRPIEPIRADFDWSTEEPVKYRPFKKGEYKLVMGIHNIPEEEWFFIEDTYLDNTNLKYGYVHDPYIREHTVFMTPDSEAATIEFYDRTTSFLLQRYPMYFEVVGDRIHNKIRDEYIPLDPRSVENKYDLNVYLSSTIEEDFIIMFQDTENYDTDEYIFKGGVVANANGFDPLERFAKPLTVIHDNVPDYKVKLKAQMNKFFDRVKPHTWVRRNNWSIQLHNRLLDFSEAKGREDEELKDVDPDTLDFEREVFFRSERQVLTRLPKTGAIAFTIRTYIASIKQLRDEGLAEELIGGIEGMQENLGIYKKKPVWAAPICSYLRGESEGIQKPWIKGMI